MSDIKALIEELRQESARWTNTGPYGMRTLFTRAADALEAQEAKIANAIGLLETWTWIPERDDLLEALGLPVKGDAKLSGNSDTPSHSALQLEEASDAPTPLPLDPEPWVTPDGAVRHGHPYGPGKGDCTFAPRGELGYETDRARYEQDGSES